MTPWWWSWLLTAVGVFGLWLAGRRDARGWAIGLAAQGLWLTYAVSTRQWGFLASAAAYGWVYARNLRRWASRGARREVIVWAACEGAAVVDLPSTPERVVSVDVGGTRLEAGVGYHRAGPSLTLHGARPGQRIRVVYREAP